MDVTFKYGDTTITLDLPEKRVLAVCRANDLPGVPDASGEIKRALANPVGSPALESLAAGKKSAAVVVDDVTRPVPYPQVLAPVLDILIEAGIPEDRISVIVAIGLHRPMTRAELDSWIGPYRGRVRIFNHEPDDPSELVDIGTTSLGTRIKINRAFMEADLKVLTGDVDYHQFCGYGGGAKSVYPGLADRAAIETNHSRMEIRGAGMGRIEGNPVREEIDEAGRTAGVDFILNVVQNSRREVTAAFAGDPIAAHRAGAGLVDQMYKVKVPVHADVVIASAGGYPKDIDLYQAQKALSAARKVVRDGGKIFLLAECREGHGSDLFDRWMREAKTPEEIFRRIRERFIMGGHKAYQYVRDMQGVEVHLYSSLPAREVEAYWLRPLRSPEETLDRITDDETIICLPDAALTCVQRK